MLGTKAQVQEKMNAFFGGLAHRKDEVKHRCRTLFTSSSRCIDFYTFPTFAIAAKCSSHLGFGLGGAAQQQWRRPIALAEERENSV